MEKRDETKVKVEIWNRLGAEFALRAPVKVLELVSEGMRHFRREKEMRAAVFIGD
jgi:hypothetical protein